MCLTFVPVSVFAEDLQQDNSISVLSITPDEGTYRTYVFKANGETISTQIVKNGDTLLEPQVPAQDGKVFTGWNPKVTFGPVSNVDKTETITVNAQFEDGYHVYFKDNNGRIIATKTVANGTKVTFEDVNFPVGSDEAITGWYKDADRTEKVDFVTINGADITLYAKVEQGYWLTFESNGGSYVAPVFYANGTAAAAPTDAPTKLGYAFDGWYTDEDLTTAADFSSITATTTLYAKWTAGTETKYTVIHWLENADDDGYSYKESETKTGTTGGTTNAKAKSYTGFTAQTITQETIAGDGSTIVSVYYKRNVYKVTFYLDDPIYNCGKEEHTHWWPGCYDWRGKLDCGKEAHTHSSACGKIETIVIEAKHGANISDQWPTVNGSSTWRTSKNGNTCQANIDTMPLGGTNFYGPKTGNRYETAYYYVEVLPGEAGTDHGGVDYKLHHKDTSPGQGYSVTKEDKYAITGFTYKDGTRDGGNYDGAKFYYTRNSYNIVFVSNGSDEHIVSKKFEQSIADVNYTPKPLTGEKSDYDFAGWYANKECTGDAYVFTGKTMPANNITLYAKWVAPTYTVTVYDVDDETVLKTFTKVPMNNTIDEANMPVDKVTKDTDDEFLGFVLKSDDNSLDGMPFNFSTKITKDYELRAKVGSKAQYSVTYNANATGATGSVTDTEKYAKGAEATVMSNSFRNGDMVFLGWNTKTDGTGKTYYPNSTVKITGDVTLYAQWGDKASTVQLTYHSNFAPDQTKTVNGIANNGQITVAAYDNTLGLPAREGYTFAGWNTEADGSGTKFSAGDSARVDNGSNDLYAQWTINQYNYTVEYYIDNVKNDSMTVTGNADFGSVINSYTDKCPTGYALEKTENLPLTIGVNESANVIKVFYKKNVFNLTIHYVYAEDQSKAADDYTKSVTFNDTYNVTSPTIDGYTADTTVVSGTMPAENVEVTVTYTKRTDLSYTVHYYWNGTTESVAPDKTVPGQSFNASVTESPVAVTGCTPVNEDSKAITIGTGKNEITFYYYKNVELTANSDEATYDGEEHSVSGFTGAPADADFSAITVGAKGTNVGTYPASFAEGTVGTVDANKKYIVTEANNGQLKINPVTDKVTVTINGHKDTKTYDGKEHSVTGYDVISISNELYTANDFALTGKDKVTGTAAGQYDMNLAFKNISENFSKVTFVVEDGKLTIAKRDVTVTGESATKVYNGQTQEINGYTVDNLVKGHEMTGVIYSAKGKDPGKYDGSFTGSQIVIKDAAGTDVFANYNVKPVIGVLTITQPSHPTRPSTPTKDVTSVKTADGSQMTLWMSMMLASAAGIVFLGKKRKEEQ